MLPIDTTPIVSKKEVVRCLQTSIHCSPSTLDKLFECNRLSANLWNDCLSLAKHFSLNNENKWINKSQLQSLTKKSYPLHSQSIQSVVHKYLFARDSTHKTKLQGLNNRYPYRTKKYFNTKWVDKSFKVLDNHTLQLSLGPSREKLMVYTTRSLEGLNIKEIELVFNRRLKLSITYSMMIPIVDTPQINFVGVDLGEIHTMSCYCTNGNGLIVTGRKMRSIHRFRNKQLAKLQKKLSHCTKGSRNYKKYMRAKRYLLSKSEEQLKDCVHKTTKQFVDWCIENEVKEVVLGDIQNIGNKTKKHRKSNRLNRQKLSNWQVGKLKKYLEYKLKEKEIKLSSQEESYTTQQCPCCGRRHKPKGRNYQCVCGYKTHRDIHSGRNILSKYLYKEIRYIGDISHIAYYKV